MLLLKSIVKVRVVFDGFFPSISGLSFNYIEMVGPVIQNDLFSILIRFRQHAYVVSANIEKMYRQSLAYFISIHASTYQLNTPTYGT